MLPDDLFDYIFGFLQSDIAALKACSRSHPNLTHLVERHLYANVSLYDNNTISENGLGTLEFTGFLSKNPHIANYIRSVKIEITSCLPEISIQHLEVIAYVLRTCSLLNQITLEHIYYTWNSLPEVFRSTFLDCLHLPSMKTVCILYVPGFPLAALNESRSVTSLTLVGWTPDRNLIAEPSSYPFLENLSIQHCAIGSALGMAVDWVQPRTLQSLHFTVPYDIHLINHLSRLLSRCSNTLQNLSIDVSSGFRTHYEYKMGSFEVLKGVTRTIPLSLSSLRCLENLTISNNLVLHFRERPDVCGFTCSIAAIACILKTSPPLQHLTLDIYFGVSGEHDLPNEPEALWSPLVSLISESPSPITTLCLKTSTLPGLRAISLERIYSSLISTADLTAMVERGVLVIIADPSLPTKNQQTSL